MRLFGYIFRRYCGYVTAAIALCLFLFIFFDFSHRARVFFSKVDSTWLDIASFYLYQLPLFTVQALPVAALLAAVLTMLVLGRSNEITAMRAAGAGPTLLAAPLLVGGLLCSALGIAAGEWLVPVSAAKKRTLEAQLSGGKKPRHPQHVWLKNGNTIFRYRAYDPYRQRLLGLKQIHLHDDFGVARIVTAEQAHYHGNTWLLTEARIQYHDKHGMLLNTKEEEHLKITLPLKLTWLQREQRKAIELSYHELTELIAMLRARGESSRGHQVDLHLKLAYPCAALFVALLGLRFGFRYQRRALRGVLATFALGFAYWLLLGISTTLGRVGALPPLVAAWFANALMLAYCLWQMHAVYFPLRAR